MEGGSRIHAVEDQARGWLQNWMNDIIRQENLPFDSVDVQVQISLNGDFRYADFVVWKEQFRQPACVIEYKPPAAGWTPLTPRLIQDATTKATAIQPQAPFFATWNTNEIVVFKTFDPDARSLVERRRGHYRIARVSRLADLRRAEVEESVKRALGRFLKDFASIYEERVELPKLPPDEFFVRAIASMVEESYYSIALEIRKRFSEDRGFRDEVIDWFSQQGWRPPTSIDDFEKAGRQFTYLLVGKTLFYHALRQARFSLPDLAVPEEPSSGETLKSELQRYFDLAQEVTRDYEPVFSANFVERMPVPNEIAGSLAAFINGFSRYDLSRLGHADIGTIFDRLIPQEERHLLGQYYTRDDLVDFINAMAIKHPSARVADFGCGVGTFLVRAYSLKRYLGDREPHGSVLEDLVGVDISKFPALWATINLAIRDLAASRNYPSIVHQDFFKIGVGSTYAGTWQKSQVATLDETEHEVEFAPFDAVVGNPPYTRQEEVEQVPGEGYKQVLDRAIKQDWGSDLKVSKMSGIHIHFLIHGLAFVREGGRIGYVMSNSWLDVGYGRFVQEFLLENSKILAVIEPKLERWFQDADINTCVLVVQRLADPIGKDDREGASEARVEERGENVVRFVQLKVPLSRLLGPQDDRRHERAIHLADRILSIDGAYEDEEIRVATRQQRVLWEEGFDDASGRYVGSKWGKYLRAPEVFFKLLRIAGDKLVPLSELTEAIRPGCYTGINDFFYLDPEDQDQWQIEEAFLKPVIRHTGQVESVGVKTADIETMVLVCDKSKEELERIGATNLLSYIEWGETQVTRRRQKTREGIPWPQVETVKRRSPGWWCIPESQAIETHNFLQYVINDRFIAPLTDSPIVSDRCFHRLLPSAGVSPALLSALLNSTLAAFMISISGRWNLGQGALKYETKDAKSLLVPDPHQMSDDKIERILEAFEDMRGREMTDMYDELGSKEPDEVSFESVKPDRIALDSAICEFLGIDRKDLLDIYRTTVDLLNARLERARSVPTQSRRKGPSLSALADRVIEELDPSLLARFPEDFLPEDVHTEQRSVEAGGLWNIGSGLDGRIFIDMGDSRIYCASKAEAEYLRFAAIHGTRSIPYPPNADTLEDLVESYRPTYQSLQRELANLTRLFVIDERQSANLEKVIWTKIASRSDSEG